MMHRDKQCIWKMDVLYLRRSASRNFSISCKRSQTQAAAELMQHLHIIMVHLVTCADQACTHMCRNLVKECMGPDSKTASSKTSTDMLRWSWKAYLMPRLSSKQQKRLHRQYK